MMALKVSIIKSIFSSVISIKINAGEEPNEGSSVPRLQFFSWRTLLNGSKAMTYHGIYQLFLVPGDELCRDTRIL